MNPSAEISAYKITVVDNITSKTVVNSISPEDVGDANTDLADLILPYLQLVANGGGDITGGTDEPDDLVGSDGDIYYRINGFTFYVYRKESGTWVAKVNLTIGILLPDGPLINLRVAVNGLDAVVSPGGWVINNIIYSKGTSTGFTIPTPDLNFYRYDLIYANTSGNILYLAGTASSTPNFPATPANSIVVDYIIVPSLASGEQPYSYYGNGGFSGGTQTILVSDTSDVNGEYDLSGVITTEFPLFTIYDENGLQASYQYDNANKKIIFMPPSTNFTARFSL